MAMLGPPYSTKPSNSVTFGLRSRLTLWPSSSTVGVTRSSTPTFRVVNSCGVPEVMDTPAEPPPDRLPVPTWDWIWPYDWGYRSSWATVIVAGLPDKTVSFG